MGTDCSACVCMQRGSRFEMLNLCVHLFVPSSLSVFFSQDYAVTCQIELQKVVQQNCRSICMEIIRASSEDAKSSNGSDFENNMKMQMDMCRSPYGRVCSDF